jgi:MFS family permease
MIKILDAAHARIEAFLASLNAYFISNTNLIGLLSGILLAAYGFELFNLNLTIDEEIHAFHHQGDQWISQGRWGMYLLNKYLLPYTVIPFVPLFLALAFHLSAVLILLRCWEVESKLEQLSIGALAVAYPGMAYMYTFNTIGYGIGVGLFSASISLLLYTNRRTAYKFLAVVPGAFSIAVYQGFIPALASVFLVHLISSALSKNQEGIDWKALIIISLIGVLSIALYYIIQQFYFVFLVPGDNYVRQLFDPGYLRDHFAEVVGHTMAKMWQVYFGSNVVYINEIRVLGVIMLTALVGFAARMARSNLSIGHKFLLTFLIILLFINPFTVGLLTKGHIAMRFLVALPVVFAGSILISLKNQHRSVQIVMGSLIAICVFQFIISTNSLFSASHLALQADRLLAANLIQRIEEAKASADAQEVSYLEVIGPLVRPATKVMPKRETFGASFFEWDQGNVYRILLFLKTVGYHGLQALPEERRTAYTSMKETMPAWPKMGSVKVVGDVVLIKFGP